MRTRKANELLVDKSVPGSRYSLSAERRAFCYCDECRGSKGLSTKAEWLAWKAENMPNGYCICDPTKGRVCGTHSLRPA